jgi:putative transposase
MIRLVPTPAQEEYFLRACGTARFSYNWALAEWKRQYAAGGSPSETALRKSLNAVKKEQFPWMALVTKNAPQQAVKNLGTSYSNFFEDLKKCRRGEISRKAVRVPAFHKKGRHDAFRAENGPDATHPDAVQTNGKSVRLPVIGWIAMREQVRFAGRILSVTIRRRADQWYASFSVEVEHNVPERSDETRAGVDLGATTLATIASSPLCEGTKVAAPKPLQRYLTKLRRLSRGLSRKRVGSQNRAKAKTKLARFHRRLHDIRLDALHKLTTSLVSYRTIVIEDLNVAGMLANRCLSRTIADLGFSEFRRQLKYKAEMAGSTVVVADRWYPSSRLCCACDAKNDLLTLSQRTWTCASCGASHDRDLNAARNLARYPESWAGAVHGAGGAGNGRKIVAKPPA